MDSTDSESSKQNFGLEELHQATERAFSGFDGTQQELAELIDVDHSAVSRALRKTGLQHASVQAKIISGVEDVPVQRRSTYTGAEVKRRWIIDPADSPAETASGTASETADDSPGDDTGDDAPESAGGDLPLFRQQ